MDTLKYALAIEYYIMQTKPNIQIIGSGIAGLTLALALAETTPLTITLLEASAKNDRTQHSRVSAITLASRNIFKNLHIWDAMQHASSSFTRIEVWDTTDHHLVFNCQDIATTALGYIIDNEIIRQCLLEKLATYPAVNIIYDIQLETVKKNPHARQRRNA